jgi:hypothetical protein
MDARPAGATVWLADIGSLHSIDHHGTFLREMAGHNLAHDAL